MMYDKILARSFSKQDQKKLGCGALVVSFLLALSLCFVFKQYLDPLAVLNLQFSMSAGIKMLMTKETSIPQQMVKAEENMTNLMSPIPPNKTFSNIAYHKEKVVTRKVEPLCNMTEPRSDFCEINKADVRIHGKSAMVYVASSQMGNDSWRIKPYARKEDGYAMSKVRRWTIKSFRGDQQIPNCHRNHSIPGILFSSGGYSGNHFHAISDIIIPLFMASRRFSGEVKFLVTDKHAKWVSKFQAILEALSRYKLTSIDNEEEVHCFPSMIVGLRHHRHFAIDPSRSRYSMKDFRHFLRSSYSLGRENAIKLRDGIKKRPRLLIVSRTRTRLFTNVEEIAKMAKRLGFKVVVSEATGNLSKFAQVVNSCDVMVGVHGAGLTNIVFLPDNAIFIQVVPLGGMEWLANTYFGGPSKDMNIRYLEYRIQKEESSLIQQYPSDHEVFRNSITIQKHGWPAFKEVYLDKQNVKVDVNRFRATLLKALELLHQ